MADLSLEQVRDFIMLRRLKPSELFSDDSLRGDKTIQALLKAEYTMREQAEKAMDAMKKEATEKVTSLEQKNKDLTLTLMTGKAQSLSQAIIAERKMPEPKAKFIGIKMPEFRVEGDVLDDATIKTQLNKFIDAKLDELTKYEAILNPAPAGGDNGKGQGDQADQGTSLIVEQ